MAEPITLKQLEMLVAIADEGSFSAAAEKVGMTQSAASQCLKALETALDVPLVARSTRKVALTDTGRRMLPPLRKALSELDAVLQAVRQQARDAGGTVRIACTAATSAMLTPKLSEIARQFPGAEVRLLESTSEIALDRVRQGSAEMAITAATRLAAGTLQVPFAEDRFVLVCRDDHPFSRSGEVALEHLRYERLIVLEETVGILRKIGSGVDGFQVVLHSGTALELVLQHFGVAVLPYACVPTVRHSTLRLVHLEEGPVWRLVLSTGMAKNLGDTAQGVHEVIARVAIRKPSHETRPITLLIPYPAAGPADALGRSFSQRLSTSTGRDILVKNVAGMGGALGIHMATRAQPDGLTLALAGTGTLIFNPLLATRDMFDVFRDLRFIGGLVRMPTILSVGAHMPARTLNELLAQARLRPGEWKIGTAGSGISHMLALSFQAEARVALKIRNYEGFTPATRDLARGEIDMIFGEAAGVLPLISTGEAYPIFTAETTRADCISSTPSAVEVGLPKVVANSGYCFVGPTALPPSICSKLSAQISAVLGSAELAYDFARFGARPNLCDSAAYEAHIRKEQLRWSKVITPGTGP